MTGLQVAPVLSTPDVHIFEAPVPSHTSRSTFTDAELDTQYEIPRTVQEIRANGWTRIALQFPDHLLPDAPKVFARLRQNLQEAYNSQSSITAGVSKLALEEAQGNDEPQDFTPQSNNGKAYTLAILADTSYGACCVDEVAAQHVTADVVIHYGRACLSPTSHLPAVHIFTINPLPLEPVISSFTSTFPDTSSKIILTSDVPYSAHLADLASSLRKTGYTNLFVAEVQHSPSSLIPNRTVPQDDAEDLRQWEMFHIGDPPQALLLTLASRLSSIHIYPVTPRNPTPSTAIQASTSLALRRRYGLLTRLSRASIIGILVNTLSVHAYMTALERIQDLITKAGKKYYVFVVGKLNPAKVANFAEVEGWVVVGCWESSLVESTEFEKPVVVPFELELALKGDSERVWTGAWRGDFDELVSRQPADDDLDRSTSHANNQDGEDADFDSEEESEPPEFDLRTGRYIQHSRPMRQKVSTAERSDVNSEEPTSKGSHSLVKRAKGDLARVGGQVSPGAEFLREKRTWQGLGSDFQVAYEEDSGPLVKEGRSGIARGYENEQDNAS